MVKKVVVVLIASVGYLMGVHTSADAAVAPTIGTFPAITTTWGVGAIAITFPTSNSSGSWSIDSSNVNVAKVVPGTNALAILNIGTSTIKLTQQADAGGAYTIGSISTTLTVNPAVPVTGDFPALTLTLQQKNLVINEPTSQSSGAWTYTSSNPNIVSVNGNVINALASGSVTLTAVQSANYNWAQVIKTATVTVPGGEPSVAPFPDVQVSLGSFANLTLSPPASTSPGAWTMTSSNPNVASIVGTVLTPLSVGQTIITAVQSAAGGFTAVTKTMTVTVLGAPPTIGKLNDVSVAYKAAPNNTFNLAPPSSNSSGSWTLTSSNPQVATISGTLVTMVGAGKTTITATQSAIGSFGVGGPVSLTLTVIGISPELGKLPDITRNLVDGKFTLTPPTSTSSATWSFQSTNPKVATVAGNEVTPVGLGTTSIVASQPAFKTWEGASVTITLTINGVVPTVGTLTNATIGFGDTPKVILPPTSNSKGAWIFTSANTSIADVVDGALIAKGVGTTTITGIQNSDANFAPSSPVTFTVNVLAKPVVGPIADRSMSLSDKSLTIINPTSTSSGIWSYVSSNSAIVTVNGNVLVPKSSGVVKITATQSATATFSAISKTFAVTVGAPRVSLKWNAITVRMAGDGFAIIPPVSSSPGTWSYTIDDLSIAVIAGGKIQGLKPGITKITATQAAAGDFGTASISTTLTVAPAVTITAVKRTILVTVSGGVGSVTINGVKAKVGVNIVTAGVKIVKVLVDGKPAMTKSVRIQ